MDWAMSNTDNPDEAIGSLVSNLFPPKGLVQQGTNWHVWCEPSSSSVNSMKFTAVPVYIYNQASRYVVLLYVSAFWLMAGKCFPLVDKNNQTKV